MILGVRGKFLVFIVSEKGNYFRDWSRGLIGFNWFFGRIISFFVLIMYRENKGRLGDKEVVFLMMLV